MAMYHSRYFWQGEKIRLRGVRESDWEEWLDDFCDSDAIRLLSWGLELPPSPEMAKAAFAQWADFKDSKSRIMFTIETLDEKPVGGINIHSKDEKNGTFSFGIRINRNHRRKGYGSEALRILLRYGFYELRFQKCNSGCVHINEGSIWLHKSVGFVEEGRQRRTIYTNGQYYDHILFGLTREEFDENEVAYKTEKGCDGWFCGKKAILAKCGKGEFASLPQVEVRKVGNPSI
ncbi:MAG TPA: GNAT family N-acetyltransferase [Clostridiales bacterium]|nr:GNAT family N-acetyltransferase [Clostridiales bacterium]